jgi:quinol-cytochrome oxidoreductase complex cytochrome b subunit
MRLWRRNKSLIYALHPEKIPASGARLTYTFGLGGITVFAATVTAFTGLALTLYYVPTPADAHASTVLINDIASFGAVIRSLHYWGAQLMVIAATLHLVRIVFTGGYRPPRELNWLIGLTLLVVTLIWDFSGYVLRWDNGAFWALLVGTNLFREIPFCGEILYRALVGDTQLGASALLRFYGWHVIGLTLIAGFGIVYHLWRLRKDGGISRPSLENGGTPAFVSRDTLLFREFIAVALLTAALLFLATFFPAPLGPAANPSPGTSEVRAPWIFLWVQNLLRAIPSLWAGIIIPLAVLGLLALVPFLDRRGPGRGVWFARARWKPQALIALLAIIVVGFSLREALR